MGTLADKKEYLLGTKEAIKQAIIGKGVNVSDEDTFRSYATKIGNISASASDSDLTELLEDTLEVLDSDAESVKKYRCYLSESLTSANLPKAKTVEASAFYRCQKLKTVDAPLLTTIDEYAFYQCESLENANVPLVASVGNYAFSNAKLKEIELPLVTTIGTYAFQHCNLTEIDLPEVLTIGNYALASNPLTLINAPKLTTLGGHAMFLCTALEVVDLPSLTKIGGSSFYGCYDLKNINMPLLTEIAEDAFNGCKSLERVVFPSVTKVNSFGFSQSTALEVVDLPVCTSIDTYAFDACSSLKALILRSETMCSLAGTNAINDTLIATGNGYVYIPRVLFDSYILGTNWVKYPAQFRILEDFTIDGTISGELEFGACTGVAFSVNELLLTDASLYKLNPIFTPKAPDEPILWTSSDETVAMVRDGIITPVRDGSCTITVSCGIYSASCDIEINAGLDGRLYDWDFTTSLVDSVRGAEATVSGATQNENGLTFSSASQTCALGDVVAKNRRIEIDIASMAISGTSNNHALVTLNTSNDSQGLLFWSQKGKAWGCYRGSTWHYYNISDLSMENKTIALEIDANGYCELFVDDISYGKTTVDSVVDYKKLFLGNSRSTSSGGDISTTVITGVRIYAI